MSTRSLSRKVQFFSALALVALVAAACSPAPKAVVTQKPPATAVPTKVVASPAPTQAAKPTATAVAKATLAPATAAAPAATQPELDVPAATEMSQPVPVAMGQAQQAGDLSIVVAKIEQQAAVGTLKPQTGHHFEVVTVTAENKATSGAAMFLPEDFLLYDTMHANSYVSVPDTEAKQLSDTLPAGEIQPGKSVSGVLVYEVPDNETKWELKYQTISAELLWALSS